MDWTVSRNTYSGEWQKVNELATSAMDSFMRKMCLCIHRNYFSVSVLASVQLIKNKTRSNSCQNILYQKLHNIASAL